MNDNKLRGLIREYRKKHGASLTFIASACGVSREHLSRWMHSESYPISLKLRTKIRSIINRLG